LRLSLLVECRQRHHDLIAMRRKIFLGLSTDELVKAVNFWGVFAYLLQEFHRCWRGLVDGGLLSDFDGELEIFLFFLRVKKQRNKRHRVKLKLNWI
jgi:hypothetical protein